MVLAVIRVTEVYGEIPRVNGVSEVDILGSQTRKEMLEDLARGSEMDRQDDSNGLPRRITKRLYLLRGLGLEVDYIV